MSIKMVEANGSGTGPVVFCDQCGEKIEKGSEANQYWDSPVPTSGAEAFHVHKTCSRAFENAHPASGHWAAVDLDTFPIRLAASLSMPMELKDAGDGAYIEYEIKGRLLNL